MRVLLSKESKLELLDILKKKNDCNTLTNLSKIMGIPLRTLQNWFYIPKRYIPKKIVPKEIYNKILDEKEENWGSVKGGKRTYKVLIEKYGLDEIRRRQSNGGKKAIANNRAKKNFIHPDIEDPLFLEFYGALLGDGWIGKYNYKNKVINLFGISGHIIQDKEFIDYLRTIVRKIFYRKGYIKEKPLSGSRELQFSHKELLNFFNKKLGFPVGKKINLKINNKLAGLDFKKTKHIIRGIFDTDGSFYYDKTPVGNPYPCISIQMKAPILIKQINDILLGVGFKVTYRKKKNMITLKGNKQLNKWMKEIGSSNPKHINKINQVRVVQSG